VCTAHYPPAFESVDKQSGTAQAAARERLEGVEQFRGEWGKIAARKVWIGNEYQTRTKEYVAAIMLACRSVLSLAQMILLDK
jgi:hypothetical protein